jgi:hypothetical protein
MTVDPSFVQLNRAATERIRRLVKRLSEKEMQHRVGEHWTVSIALAHIAFWDRRAMYVMDATEREGKFVDVQPDLVVNDLSLPLWGAIQPREAARLAIETADALDKRLEAFPAQLLEEIYEHNQRYVVRALHRNEHLNEVDSALKS